MYIGFVFGIAQVFEFFAHDRQAVTVLAGLAVGCQIVSLFIKMASVENQK